MAVPADRAPLDVAAVRAALGAGFVTAVDLVQETTSTNSDLAAVARDGAPEGTVLVAEFQRAGRGRFTRVWTSPPRAGLTFSLLLRPTSVPVSQWGWVPLLTGVALHDAVSGLLPSVDVTLKWPNDLLLGPSAQKSAGILAEAGAGWIVVGVGLNVDTSAAELPSDQAASLRSVAGEPLRREDVLVAVLTAFGSRYRSWLAAAGDPDSSGLRAAYESVCGTLGRDVEVRRPDGIDVGRAVAIDDAGALVVDTVDGVLTVSAGDIAHVRAPDR